jgi:transcriptional regulator LmrA/YxaF-like protein
LATVIIAAVEGAVVMCRAERTPAPLNATVAEIHDLVAQALAAQA